MKRELKAAARKTLGPRFIRHYIYPLNARTRVSPGAPTAQQDELARGLDDSLTIMQGYSPLKTRYHYNAVENSILYHFFEHPPTQGMAVLDVGSGAGHWIDFYRSVLGAGRVVGIELVPQVAAALQRKYEADDDVTVLNADVVDGVGATPPFDVVNAIGVMFHIVEDDRWRRAVANLGKMLAPGGAMIVGGQFGPFTHDVGFRRRADAPGNDSVEVFKRLRSRRQWRDCARAAGLRQVEYIHTARSRMVDTPESNLLVFERGR